MATIYITSTRALESTNLTYGKGKLGAVTLTGIVYNCEGYKVKHRDENGIVHTTDMSDQVYGATTTVTMDAETAKEVSEAVEKYFTKKAEKGIHELKAGVVVECTQLKLLSGTHPTSGAETKNLLLQDVEFVKVTTPEEVILDAEEFITDSAEAQEKTKVNGAASLTAYLKKKAESMLMGAANEGLNSLKAASKKKKTTV